MVMGWEHFPHDADVGVRGFGPTVAAAFEQVARALTAAVTDPDRVREADVVEIACKGADREQLLYDWLNAIVFEMATRGMVFVRYSVSMDESGLTAELWGEPVDVARHEPAAEIKGATYTELKVFCEEDGGWVAQCVLDV